MVQPLHLRRSAGRALPARGARAPYAPPARALARALAPAPAPAPARRGARGRGPGAAGAAAAEGAKAKTVREAFGGGGEGENGGRCALIPFIVAGDPDLATTAAAVRALDRHGADVIELGVPYSDPLADGPTIQAAAARALEKKTLLQEVIDMVAGVAPEVAAPIVMFTYFNPIMAMGLDTFCERIKAAGVAGLLVPDLPLEETGIVQEAAKKAGIELVLLVTPTTPEARMAKIAAASEGFVYLVSLAGVTGARAEVSDRVEELIQQLKRGTGKPVAVGFGVSQPEHAAKIKGWGADGVIVGSALVKALAEEGLDAMVDKIKSLRAALD